MIDWNDVRYFLAVAEHGSTLAAAKSLQISQPTVMRRINTLERGLCLTLFERSPGGYTLTEAGTAMLASCGDLARSAHLVEEAALSFGREVAGTVRISVFEIFATTFLAMLLDKLRQSHPLLRIELDLSDTVRDIAAGEADIAVRSAIELSSGSLVCRKLIEERWGYGCSASYAAANGIPHTPEEARSHVVIGDGSEDFWPAYRDWRREHGLANTVDFHHGQATAVLDAVRGGLGVGLLPLLAIAGDPSLVLCFEGPRTGHHLWLVTSERLRHAPRVRVVMDSLASEIRALAERQGEGSADLR